MITLIDIQKAISRKLYGKFATHYIYVEEVKNGLKRPSFFIDVMPVSTDNFTAHSDKLIHIDIMYFSTNETNNENLTMINDLEQLFTSTLSFTDKEITIKSLSFRIVDSILHCNFDLDFTDTNVEKIKSFESTILNPALGYTEETITTMQELNIEEV